MTEATAETIEVTQDSPESGELNLQQFKEARQGKTLTVPKPAEAEVKAEPVTEPKLETETKTEEKVEEKVEDKPKGKKDPTKRIEKLTRERYELEEERDRLREEVQKLRGGKVEPEKTVDAADPKPTLEAFSKAGKTYEDWVEAVGAWKARQEFKSLRADDTKKAQEEEQQARVKEIFDTYQKRIDDFRKNEHDDIDELVQDAQKEAGGIHRDAGMAIMELDNGPAVLHYLATHVEELKTLNGMSSMRAIARVGAISDSLMPKAKEEKKEPPKSKAPEPITPVSTGTGKVETDPEKMSLADYKKWRKERQG